MDVDTDVDDNASENVHVANINSEVPANRIRQIYSVFAPHKEKEEDTLIQIGRGKDRKV